MFRLKTTLAFRNSLFLARKTAPHHIQFLKRKFPSLLSSSSYDVDSDDIVEQPIQRQEHGIKKSNDTTKKGRYSSLLKDIGIDGELRQVSCLNDKRKVTQEDLFCNREINFSSLQAIGFDMDYTLAQYKQPAFDKLSFEGGKEKLVKLLGYPKEVLDIEYDHELWVRGLIMDIERGNFLKIDRHKYVRVAYHGLRQMSSLNRKLIYSRTFNVVHSFSEKHFINMDTHFQHVDAHLFANLIELKDTGKYEGLNSKTYEDMYREMRKCIDLCHRDGVIKDEVALNPEKYIITDDGMVPMLKKIKESGTKVFLLTNSLWEYTSVAMNYLFHQKNADEETKLKNEWLDLFDVVIVGSCKPAFLLDPYLNLYRIQTENGSLLNTDGLYEMQMLGEFGVHKFLEQGKVFQGGNWQHLQAMLEAKAGEEILYVGDHLYSDVLRSKRTLGWRTCLIIPELELDMKTYYENRKLAQNITELRKLQDEMNEYADTLRNENEPIPEEVNKILKDLEYDDTVIKDRLREMAKQYHEAFHPMWGQIFRAGYQDSRFAFYVQNYACIYMSKASNLGLISMERSLRTSGEMLPHDKLLSAESTFFDQN